LSFRRMLGRELRDLTFKAVAAGFIAAQAEGSKKRSYLTSFKHLVEHLGKTCFGDLVPSHIERYKQTHEEQKRKTLGGDVDEDRMVSFRASIQHELVALKALFRWLNPDDDLEDKDARFIPFLNRKIRMYDRKDADNERDRILTPAEEARLLAGAVFKNNDPQGQVCQKTHITGGPFFRDEIPRTASRGAERAGCGQQKGGNDGNRQGAFSSPPKKAY